MEKGDKKGFLTREHERVIVNEMIRVTHDGNSGEALLKDISLGGALLEWLTSLGEGDIVTVHFSSVLYFNAEIRWCREAGDRYDVGVQFQDLDDIAALYLGEFIEELKLINDDDGDNEEFDTSFDDDE